MRAKLLDTLDLVGAKADDRDMTEEKLSIKSRADIMGNFSLSYVEWKANGQTTDSYSSVYSACGFQNMTDQTTHSEESEIIGITHFSGGLGFRVLLSSK